MMEQKKRICCKTSIYKISDVTITGFSDNNRTSHLHVFLQITIMTNDVLISVNTIITKPLFT